MLAFWDGLSGLELLFASCAVFGTVLLAIRLLLLFIGGFDDGHTADTGDMDGGMDAGDMDHTGDMHDSDLSFKLLSLQGITAFFMMFGLVGWAVIRQGQYPPLVPIASGTAAGLVTVWIMKKIFQIAGSLQSSGTLDLKNAVGREGTVYLTIRPGQSGKVQVDVQERVTILEAVTGENREIKTGEPVRVIGLTAGKLVVEKLNT